MLKESKTHEIRCDEPGCETRGCTGGADLALLISITHAIGWHFDPETGAAFCIKHREQGLRKLMRGNDE